MSKQSQSGGDDSINIQAGGNVSYGLDYSAARQVALDVFEANFYRLAGQAREIASERAEKITEDFLCKLIKDYPAGIEQSKDPDFQHGLFTMQKEYARCGDEDLGALLVSLMVERAKNPSRSLSQIVLNESIEVVPKLTPQQISTLSLVFAFRYKRFGGVGNLQSFYTALRECVNRYKDGVLTKMAGLQHLQYTGCGSIAAVESQLGELFLKVYTGFFFAGFDDQVLFGLNGVYVGHPIIIGCINDSTKYQINALNDEVLEQQIAKYSLEGSAEGLRALYLRYRFDVGRVKDVVIENVPEMKVVFDAWSKMMGYLTLTSVGMAIAHAHMTALEGPFADVSLWLE